MNGLVKKIKWDIVVYFALFILIAIFTYQMKHSEENWLDPIIGVIFGWVLMVILTMIEFLINLVLFGHKGKKSVFRLLTLFFTGGFIVYCFIILVIS